MLFSLRSPDKRDYHANEEITILVHPDSSGSFDPALSKIFAVGLADLANSVPLYWQCYAMSYFKPAVVSDDAEETVERCVTISSNGDVPSALNTGATGTSPELLSPLVPQFPQRDADLGVSGKSVIHVRVQEDGTPVGLQIVRALGGGVDEALLQAISHARFRPGTRAGVPVPPNMDLSFQFGPP